MLKTYYRDKLSVAERVAYDDMYHGIRLRQKEIKMRYVEGMHSVINAVSYDHPELFFVNWLECMTYRVCCGQAYLKLKYIYNEEEIETIDRRIKDIALGIEGVSDYGKALLIHDWFVKNIKYDRKGLKEIIQAPGMYSAAGPLIRGRGVCIGISRLACYIMREKGLDATVMIGRVKKGERHAWNMLRVEDEILHADITFDIGISRGGAIQRKYFLLPEREILKDRTIEKFK